MHCLFFDVHPKAGHLPHYFEHVDKLKPILAEHRGLLYLERFRPLDNQDALLSHQLWEDEAAIAEWRREASHRVSQTAGRVTHFQDYRIRVGPQQARFPEEPAAIQGQDRFLVAAYGAAPGRQGRAYESVSRPDRFVTLAETTLGSDAETVALRAEDEGADDVRVFRITRDYTMHDRAEAPK